jgi:predicted secreted protein
MTFLCAAASEEATVFEDKRSRKVVFLAHCVLNQNAKLDRCAHYPGAIRQVTEAVLESGAGIVQLPCPELLLLGLDRQAIAAACPTVPAEDTRIARRMVEEAGQTLCREIARSLVYQIAEYRKNGFEIVGMVGINGSPTCGVETTWSNDREHAGQGVLIQALCEELDRRGYAIPLRGIKAYEPQQATAIVMDLLRATHAP